MWKSRWELWQLIFGISNMEMDFDLAWENTPHHHHLYHQRIRKNQSEPAKFIHNEIESVRTINIITN